MGVLLPAPSGGTGKELVLLRHERFGLDLKKDFLTTEVDGESTSFTY